MSTISLTASMRSNLLSLQNTQSLMDTTQERLSTGKKVNSAIDNPSSYYTAQSLNNRAGDLSALLDSMGQAIQTIKAADEGIEAITAFAQQAKAVAQSAADSNDVAERTNYEKQFNEILKQIDAVAQDSGYKGVNLLASGNLTVKFSENENSKLDITGVDASTGAGGLNVAKATDWDKEGTTTAAKKTAMETAKDNLDAAIEAGNAVTIAEKQGLYDTAVAEYNAAVAADVKGDQATAIKNSIEALDTAISQLRTWASEFGNNYSIVQSREDFTENLINVLTEGADKLTLADMNEESANMLALQTRQQLAVNSLSLASQAAQSVLRLF